VRRALFLVLATGCATTSSERTTWEEDRRDGVGSSVPRSPHRPKIGAVDLARPLEEATLDAEPEAAIDSTVLELAILRFTTKRRQLAHELPASQKGPWPRPIEAAFDHVIEELDRGLSAPKGSLPRRVLIQARVTVEVEIENSEARYGPAPRDLMTKVGRLFGSIAMHMRASAPIRDERRAWSGDREIALAWPVSPVIVTSAFGYRRDPILGRENVRFHAGVDLGGENGDVINASGPGRVVSAGWLGGHGRTVVVQHAAGYQTMYAHLRQIVTSIGAEVETGSPIGLMGSSGRSTGPHLHFEVRRGGVPLDPLEVLGPVFAEKPSKHGDSAAARD
jgi:murein DD-endopeptidase MepM/ murein hydrolase activator NlpD